VFKGCNRRTEDVSTCIKSKTAEKLVLCPNTKGYVCGKSNTTQEYHSSYFQAWWWLHHVMGMLVIGEDYSLFLS
jgi:hypothetical protein